MKILFISTLYPIDSVSEQFVTTALKEFTDEWEKIHEVYIIRPVFNSYRNRPSCVIKNVIVQQGIRVVGLESYFIDLDALINQVPIKPDIVIAHMFKSYLWAHKIALHYKVPFVAGVHYSDIKFLDIGYFRRKFGKQLSRSDAIACRSPAMQNQVHKYFPELKRKTFCVSSGIDSSLVIDLDSALNKCKKWMKTKCIHFSTAARLQKRKNIAQTIYALSQLPSVINWEFKVIGDGPERESLEQLVDDLGLNERVIFKGWVSKENVYNELINTDIFILVSAPETFGLVYLEALAAGNIIIAAKEWGVDGFITHDVTGYLCSPKNIDELNAVLRKIVSGDSFDSTLSVIKNSHALISSSSRIQAAKSYIDNLEIVINTTH